MGVPLYGIFPMACLAVFLIKVSERLHSAHSWFPGCLGLPKTLLRSVHAASPANFVESRAFCGVQEIRTSRDRDLWARELTQLLGVQQLTAFHEWQQVSHRTHMYRRPLYCTDCWRSVCIASNSA